MWRKAPEWVAPAGASDQVKTIALSHGDGHELLLALTAKYVWWKTPDEALRQPGRVAAQVMDIGDFDDVQALAERLGDDCLREVLGFALYGGTAIALRLGHRTSVDFDFFNDRPLDATHCEPRSRCSRMCWCCRIDPTRRLG